MYIPTSKELESLYRKALHGNKEAETDLRVYNRQLAKLANQRMSALEKAGKDYYAYDVAYGYVETTYGGNRFRYDYISVPTVNDLYENLKHAKQFLESKTSTLRGQRALEKQRLESFRAMGINIPKDSKSERLFIEFLRDEDMLTSLKEVYGSNEVFGLLANALAPRRTRTKRLEDFVNAFAKSSKEADKLLHSYGSSFVWDEKLRRYKSK